MGGVRDEVQIEFKHKKESLIQIYIVLTVVIPGMCLLRDELCFIVPI